MENWLQSTVSLGQFENELGIDGTQFNGKPFSLFVPKEAVKYTVSPTTDRTVPGHVKVEVVDQKGDLILVQLPRQTFQGGAFVTVKADQLESVIRTKRKKVHA